MRLFGQKREHQDAELERQRILQQCQEVLGHAQRALDDLKVLNGYILEQRARRDGDGTPHC